MLPPTQRRNKKFTQCLYKEQKQGFLKETQEMYRDGCIEALADKAHNKQPQENKFINMGPDIYRFTPYWHSKEVRTSMNVPTFWIITREVFIVRHSSKYSHSPKKIRNQTVARRIGNWLNFLRYDETKESQYGLRQVCHR